MYMSVEDQYFWELILVISIGITFAFWYVKKQMKEQYQLGYDQGWDDCYENLEMLGAIEE